MKTTSTHTFSTKFPLAAPTAPSTSQMCPVLLSWAQRHLFFYTPFSKVTFSK